MNDIPRGARRKYGEHKRSAQQRGIPFLLSFEQWWRIWQKSGHWDQRGATYVMSRPMDTGPYAVGNVAIVTSARNAADRDKRKRAAAAGVYQIELEPDDNNTLLVTCKAFPELTTFGSDEADALAHAVDALEEVIAARIADGIAIPSPSPARKGHTVRLPALTTLKVALYTSMRQQHVTRAELSRRLKWHREQVDRLFRLDHASRLDQLEAAFRALSQRVDVCVREAA